MSSFRRVTDSFWVSPQISVDDVAEAKAQGFQVIINNRPDGEAPAQPAGEEIAAAARAAGLDYIAAPVTGRPSPQAVAAVVKATADPSRKVLAFCRSGTRSINTWAMGQAGEREKGELIRLGDAAGYDVRAVVG
ncbi:MAG TPA: TIGR01244 family sulfur transferase [Caulobacteraceae bacterium]